MATVEDQQFCLRWNNFQANITSQFETLRDDEDFVDVTLACEGQRLEAHKVVLSACSPFFKELFKSNPCPHPIIFMRDVEARHIVALLEFMYAGEVNVAQAQLSGFLKTAESLQIRGLTDANKVQKDGLKGQREIDSQKQQHSNDAPLTTNTKSTTNYMNTTSNKHNILTSYSKKPVSPRPKSRSRSPSSNGGSHLRNAGQERKSEKTNMRPSNDSPIPPKKQCKTESQQNTENEKETETDKSNTEMIPSPASTSNSNNINPFPGIHHTDIHTELDLATEMIEPKIEPDYPSDEDDNMRSDSRMDESILGFDTTELGNAFGGIHGAMEIIPGTSVGELSQDSKQALSDSRKLHSLDPRPCHLCGRVYSNLSNLRQHMRLIHHPQTVACPICGKQFKTKLYMKRHLVIYHHEVIRTPQPPTHATESDKQSNQPTANTLNDIHNQNIGNATSLLEIKHSVYAKNNNTVSVSCIPNNSAYPFNNYNSDADRTHSRSQQQMQSQPDVVAQLHTLQSDNNYLQKEFGANPTTNFNAN